jgi:hypothetical protein
MRVKLTKTSSLVIPFLKLAELSSSKDLAGGGGKVSGTCEQSIRGSIKKA